MAVTCPWDSFEPATINFCEERLCSLIVEPSNTWSNLGFIFVGFLLLYISRHNLRDYLVSIPITAILVGIGSFLFHMTGTWIGEFLDVSAMFLISGLFITFNLRRLYNLSNGQLVLIYTATCCTFIAVLWQIHIIGILLFTFQVAIAIILEMRLIAKYRDSTDYRYLKLVAITFTAAFLIWRLDITGVVCEPTNHFITGHAVWHILNAAVLYFYYKFNQQFKYVRSSENTPND